MLFYFSGTGNSTYVALTLSNFLGLKAVFIPSVKGADITSAEENILFVFPVYSWGVPPVVLDFISELPESFWDSIKSQDLNVDCVMTCGDEVAKAPEMLKKALARKGVILNSIWSVIMPNNYVLLPGFDVDSKKLEEEKLKSCEKRIMEIAQGISRGEKREDVVRGSIPWIKTTLVYPLFKKWGVFPKKWHYLPECIGCGQCASICPMWNVKMENGHPVWGSRCCSCLGCYHVCPVHAVMYGKETSKKGQYIFPLRKISSLHYHK